MDFARSLVIVRAWSLAWGNPMRLLLVMRFASVLTAALILAALSVERAQAHVSVRIDVSAQIMTVAIDGTPYATWRVSTARSGYYTPRGSYKPYLLKRMHYSRKYDNSPMPHSVFFKGGYAIHGTNYIKALGRPASHGCIRLAPGNAARLFALVSKFGMSKTRIVIAN